MAARTETLKVKEAERLAFEQAEKEEAAALLNNPRSGFSDCSAQTRGFLLGPFPNCLVPFCTRLSLVTAGFHLLSADSGAEAKSAAEKEIRAAIEENGAFLNRA